MSNTQIAHDLRQKIIQDPSVLLDDADVMRALVGANGANPQGNVVDLRSVAMSRLEARFDRLEDTHRTVIAAAYDNLAGTNQVHRAVLRLMEAQDLEGFMAALTGEVAATLRVDAIRLILESSDEIALTDDSGPIAIVPENFVDGYITLGRNTPARPVTLRPFHKAGLALYGQGADALQSEACLKLDLGANCMPAMILMGSNDPQLFTPQQATDLMAFFAGVAERMLHRWLASQ